MTSRQANLVINGEIKHFKDWHIVGLAEILNTTTDWLLTGKDAAQDNKRVIEETQRRIAELSETVQALAYETKGGA
jgi:hypothetical protein